MVKGKYQVKYDVAVEKVTKVANKKRKLLKKVPAKVDKVVGNILG